MVICVLCDRKIPDGKEYHIGNLPVHKKCKIEYTAWEVIEDFGPEILNDSFQWRAEQIRRNLMHELNFFSKYNGKLATGVKFQ
jgi:hypothetical protein